MTDDKPIPIMRLPSLQREDRSAVMERAEQREAERLAAAAAGDDLPSLGHDIEHDAGDAPGVYFGTLEYTARLFSDVDALPPPARTIAVGESIRDRFDGGELPPLDTEVLDMTDDVLRRTAHRRRGLELDEAVSEQRRLTELVWDLEAQVTELRARDLSIVGAVVRTLRKRLRGDR